jgi:hypothetical protein
MRPAKHRPMLSRLPTHGTVGVGAGSAPESTASAPNFKLAEPELKTTTACFIDGDSAN